ncbi:protein translocase subunit SecD [Peterkaempfera bronchialis]|uniref:Multifunctional fusion protein n=1 Tax=Peterkaempfera bronchialis TaxID=2126346 RepID=A0A345T008_9ACTN|nr:protein translocase subunit SecD [Peterkaempfera bronchialis]AXI79313.1 protein translocase subunit SecD [Peterkaempfera bronchialis]
MTRATAVRAVLALAVLLGSAFLTVTKSPRLGLDLRGGTQIVLEARDTATAKADRDTTERAMEVLRKRIDALGVAEPTLTQSGDRRIIVELPSVQDPKQAADILGRTAQLAFHPVLGATEPGATATPGTLVMEDESGTALQLGAAGLTGSGVKGAEAQLDSQQGLGWYVTVDFRGDGGKAWSKLTGDAACQAPGDPRRRVAIVLDDKVISSPQVDPSVSCNVGITGSSTQITGSFSPEEARELALLIQGGALPVPVDVVEQRTVGPTLGAAAIAASTEAAVIGVACTAIFLICVYRLFGALAAVALASYGLISYAALLALGATLTLPGLAGFVLAIGMAVDANVLVFERAREEYAASRRRGLAAALTAGFRNAWSAIADSNITTLLAAGLLFFFASGPVRGFGVTLGIGVLASMVSALVVTRALTDVALALGWVRRRPGLTGIAGLGSIRTRLTRMGPNLLRHPRRWLAIAAAVTVLAGSGIAVRGLNLDVEFTGGRLVEYTTSRTIDAETARQAVSDAGFPRATVGTAGSDAISIRTGQLSEADRTKIEQALEKVGGSTTKLRDEFIGPSLGAELRRGALIALGVALAAQLGYLAIRFRWTFAAASVTAMAHDVVVLVGVFAWLGKPIDGVFLAALLTVIGYSVNDSVVVFDRVRELWARARKTPFQQIANDAVLQTVPRTVNTGLGAVFILTALAVLGGDSLTDFAIALLIGIVVGTWSSMFTAAPLAVELESHRPTPPPPAAKRSPGAVGAARHSNGAQV